MSITITPTDDLGSIVTGYTPETATAEDYEAMKKEVYDRRLVVLKDQQDLTPEQFVELGHKMGTIIPYYEPMYHHPEHKEIFVSNSLPPKDGTQVGVPRTGKFWHSDYQFKEEPFSFTIFAPKVLPEGSRGTFFIDLAEAFNALPEELKDEARKTTAEHSVRRFFKIRPEDVYRPLGEIIDEVEKNSPAVTHNTVTVHPVTGEEILYISEGFTNVLHGGRDGLLEELLEHSGQLDKTFEHPLIKVHPYEPGEVVIWDNRVLAHRALHVVGENSGSMSHRVTVVDGKPFDARSNATQGA